MSRQISILGWKADPDYLLSSSLPLFIMCLYILSDGLHGWQASSVLIPCTINSARAWCIINTEGFGKCWLLLRLSMAFHLGVVCLLVIIYGSDRAQAPGIVLSVDTLKLIYTFLSAQLPSLCGVARGSFWSAIEPLLVWWFPHFKYGRHVSKLWNHLDMLWSTELGSVGY